MSIQSEIPAACALAQLSRGSGGRIHSILVGKEESKRLQVMGLHAGSPFTLLLGPDRRGVVLDSAGTRIALGREWLERILVLPLQQGGENYG